MKDEFPITRNFNCALCNISSMVFGAINNNMSHMNDFYKQELMSTISSCKNAVDEVENEYGYVEWSMKKWPIMIRELLDSAEYRNELQSYYDKWIKVVMNIKVWSDNDLKWLFKDKDEEDPVYNGAKTILRRVCRMMEAVYILVQEFKMEYDLHDEEDYQPVAFLDLAYPNDPSEKENSSTGTLIIPNYIYLPFKDEMACEDYFSWEKYTTDPQDWGRRFCKYGKPNSKLNRDDKKNIFDFLIKIHPDISYSKKNDGKDYDRDLDRFRRAIV